MSGRRGAAALCRLALRRLPPVAAWVDGAGGLSWRERRRRTSQAAAAGGRRAPPLRQGFVPIVPTLPMLRTARRDTGAPGVAVSGGGAARATKQCPARARLGGTDSGREPGRRERARGAGVRARRSLQRPMAAESPEAMLVLLVAAAAAATRN